VAHYWNKDVLESRERNRKGGRAKTIEMPANSLNSMLQLLTRNCLNHFHWLGGFPRFAVALQVHGPSKGERP
jgi:hypothetical protein